MLKITEDISYAALFKNNAKVGDIVQLEGVIDFIIFSASIDNSSFLSLLQSSTIDNFVGIFFSQVLYFQISSVIKSKSSSRARV